MYNKIASIILNSGKNNNYAGEVFVSQPDSNKERLAGKIFVLAEIEGRKSETQKIINFLVNIFDYNYYGDEKILLRDKIEGIKIEDIFETVLARVNQGLIDFLQDERLRINPESTNLTLGVIHEDKLYFSNYGKNKAFLIYRRKCDYEIINIESNVTDGEDIVPSEVDESNNTIKGKIFSAVINGEIPPHSYFLFTNEALPEYLSNREMVNIITKLPPMVAAEQIKNFLQKINSFAPFLGVIIKSTIGTGLNESLDLREDDSVNQVAGNTSSGRNIHKHNAHNSISHLNYTEQKTENMLSPAGIINVKKIVKSVQDLLSRFKVEVPENKKVVKFYDDESANITIPPRDRKNKELGIQDSFAIKERIIFKKKKYFSFSKIKNFFLAFGVILTPNFWRSLFGGLSSWIKSLGKRDRVLVGALAICFFVLLTSVIYGAFTNKTRMAAEQFDQVVVNIDNKQADVFRYTAVGNDIDAAGVLNELIISLQNSLPQNKEQQAKKESLLATLFEQSDKLQKITKIENLQEIVSVSAWNAQAGADNLVLADDKLYLSDGLNNSIYNFNLKDSSRNQISLIGGARLTSPSVNGANIYYLAGQKVFKVTNQSITPVTVDSSKLSDNSLMQTYLEFIYILNKNDNKIYRYSIGSTSANDWLSESADLSQVTDFKIDGKVHVSQLNGDILKFGKVSGRNVKMDYKTAPISPVIRADKIIITANNYYLLDIKNSRLINLTKEGSLVKQYRLIKDNLKDFAIDEASKSAYILAGTSVYKFGL